LGSLPPFSFPAIADEAGKRLIMNTILTWHSNCNQADTQHRLVRLYRETAETGIKNYGSAIKNCPEKHGEAYGRHEE
jgi:hypothetical protein